MTFRYSKSRSRGYSKHFELRGAGKITLHTVSPVGPIMVGPKGRENFLKLGASRFSKKYPQNSLIC